MIHLKDEPIRALPNVQRITELEPKNPFGWALVSECEVRLAS